MLCSQDSYRQAQVPRSAYYVLEVFVEQLPVLVAAYFAEAIREEWFQNLMGLFIETFSFKYTGISVAGCPRYPKQARAGTYSLNGGIVPNY